MRYIYMQLTASACARLCANLMVCLAGKPSSLDRFLETIAEWTIKYRVTLVVADICWVDFDLDGPSCCPADSAKFPSAQAEPCRQWNEQNHSPPNRYSFPMVGWTEIGHQIQSLSKLCQNPVQYLYTRKKSTGSVQSSTRCVQWLSRVCRVSVLFKSFWSEFGYGNPGFVQTLSNKHYPKRQLLNLNLDKL